MFVFDCYRYCTSEGPSTKLVCLHCKTKYCGACLHGESGKMESLIKCAKCGKKPRVLASKDRGEFGGANSGVGTSQGGYSPSAALKMQHKENKTSSRSSPSTSEKKLKSNGKQTIFDKLTDTSLYTGAHKHRFTQDGKGKGLAGRDAASGQEYGASKVNDLSQILRPGNSKVKPLAAHQVSTTTEKAATSTTPKKKKDGPSIFDKLTDPKLYTGAHKHRFGSDGKGRGMAGRDAASGIEYGSGKVNDISSILRPGFH